MDSFWDYVWYTIIVFAFVAYLIVLFHIVVDVFRDNTLSGFTKGVWMIALVFFPYISAFIYLIARGRGMSLRSQQAQTEAQQAADDYIRRVAVGKSAPEQIADAKALLDSGAINATEFEQLKAQALGRNTAAGDSAPVA
ncbi:SHOCT domain-containing protein [Rhodococcus chondri]|uniref:SHOCT domain-containing protein n=1 Tax=Rhodococcus chondri TaxID=3065941 RepID=A0ABU7JX43_9NOCA|nr:SHOCT domain-containing protein [Rhodococcus sp. CC-R104]MEE2033837.1 SHOCT domain-containing protein [Rhodococcus sp. CC-R104]